MSDGAVAVPVVAPGVGAKDVDCEIVSRGGVDYYKQRVEVRGISDHYDVQQYLAPNGEVVALPLHKLVGDIYFDGVLDTTRWISSVGTGGSAVVTGGHLVISTGTTANNTASVRSVHPARFSGLAPNKCRIPLQCPDGGTTNNVREWGVVTPTWADGAFFRIDGTTVSCVTVKAGVETVRATAGTMNGQFGTSFTMGANSHFFEIIYQPRQVVWLADNKIIHTYSAVASPWSETLHLYLGYRNYNKNGSATNVELQVRLGVIARFGIPEVQKDSHFQSGLTTGVVLKIGPGVCYGLTLSSVTNNAAITLHDGVSAAAPVFFSTGAMPTQSAPLSMDLGGAAFNDGLFLVISGAASNAYVVFD